MCSCFPNKSNCMCSGAPLSADWLLPTNITFLNAVSLRVKGNLLHSRSDALTIYAVQHRYIITWDAMRSRRFGGRPRIPAAWARRISERPTQHIYLCCSCILNGQRCRGGRGGISRWGRRFSLEGGEQTRLNHGGGEGRGGGGGGGWKQRSGKGVDTRGEDRERRRKSRAEEDAVRSQGRLQGQLSEW